eukprot:CAMPEP_0113501116 /NCGR_PEP_ID=MMETSP0014_2-20120614/32762_1 /TAXON_ID=2857 /ORGANISM="Nitzschia sp." /LENGTH=279 /DNA_ID=CAMNT_0000395641 /DNA_START=145 /DNA_END=980 /DNA_ORIENTATION=- /assembly_acc=CAM_ASM_000159
MSSSKNNSNNNESASSNPSSSTFDRDHLSDPRHFPSLSPTPSSQRDTLSAAENTTVPRVTNVPATPSGTNVTNRLPTEAATPGLPGIHTSSSEESDNSQASYASVASGTTTAPRRPRAPTTLESLGSSQPVPTTDRPSLLGASTTTSTPRRTPGVRPLENFFSAIGIRSPLPSRRNCGNRTYTPLPSREPSSSHEESIVEVGALSLDSEPPVPAAEPEPVPDPAPGPSTPPGTPPGTPPPGPHTPPASPPKKRPKMVNIAGLSVDIADPGSGLMQPPTS